MRLLLDTNILIPYLEEESGTLRQPMRDALHAPQSVVYVSVASLWEVALKSRLGKLPLKKALEKLPETVEGFEMLLLPIDERHVLAELHENPPTRDPFDRLLPAQCQVENLRLVTIDRALADHRLAWREA